MSTMPVGRTCGAWLREVLGLHVVEELAELLDLLLLVVPDDDRGLGEDVLRGEDGDVHPDRQRDGVRRAGRDLVPLPAVLQLDRGEEGALLELRDRDALDLHGELL